MHHLYVGYVQTCALGSFFCVVVDGSTVSCIILAKVQVLLEPIGIEEYCQYLVLDDILRLTA